MNTHTHTYGHTLAHTLSIPNSITGDFFHCYIDLAGAEAATEALQKPTSAWTGVTRLGAHRTSWTPAPTSPPLDQPGPDLTRYQWFTLTPSATESHLSLRAPTEASYLGPSPWPGNKPLAIRLTAERSGQLI